MAGNCAKAAGQEKGTAADRTFGAFSFFDTKADAGLTVSETIAPCLGARSTDEVPECILLAKNR